MTARAATPPRRLIARSSVWAAWMVMAVTPFAGASVFATVAWQWHLERPPDAGIQAGMVQGRTTLDRAAGNAIRSKRSTR